ncbi:MAG: hypothetical protein II859_12855 [Bacteroidales bacterium]|nr:hypothetical protein [Bacteroidales bacterium]
MPQLLKRCKKYSFFVFLRPQYDNGSRTGDYLISTNGTPITCQCDYMLLTRHENVKSYVFRSPEGEEKEIEW